MSVARRWQHQRLDSPLYSDVLRGGVRNGSRIAGVDVHQAPLSQNCYGFALVVSRLPGVLVILMLVGCPSFVGWSCLIFST